MKNTERLILFLIVALIGVASAQAEQTDAERRAFARRYGLWGTVRCMADSVHLRVETDGSVAAEFPEPQIRADAKAQLERLGFPRFCDPKVTPAPATMVSLEMDIRTVVDEEGSVAYFVRLMAVMPDGDFTRFSFGQQTNWESSGKLGYVKRRHSRKAIQAAMAGQIDEFAAFMLRARRMGRGQIRVGAGPRP